MADRQPKTNRKKGNTSANVGDNQSLDQSESTQETTMSAATMSQFMTLWLEDSKRREAERIQERKERQELEERCLEEQREREERRLEQQREHEEKNNKNYGRKSYSYRRKTKIVNGMKLEHNHHYKRRG